jgi:hypothetical protein
MKAIKFVILGCGILGLLSFFLPLISVNIEGKTESFSSMAVISGVDVAKAGVSKVKDELKDNAGELGDQGAEFKGKLDEAESEIQKGLDAVKVFVLILFVPSVLLTLIGGVATFRRKLGRLGGAGALFVGLIGMALAGLVLAAFGELKDDGGSAGIAVYLQLVAGVGGFFGGLLTLIKPDIGGRFG